MSIDIPTLTTYVNAFLSVLGLAQDHDHAQLLTSFATFVDGKQAEQQAVAYLQAKGYSVTAPGTATS